MSRFTGFPAEGLAVLAQLPTRDKAWFNEQRAIYESALAAPAKTFVDDLGQVLRESISESIVAIARTNGSIAPINNDVRFAKDKSPYKDHLLFRFWEGENKKTAATLYVRLSAHEVGFASGIAFADVDTWRRVIDDKRSGPEIERLLKRVGKGRELDVAGSALKKVPAPFAADHPRADLLKHKMFQVRWAEACPAIINKPSFIAWCSKRLLALADVHNYLVRYVN